MFKVVNKVGLPQQ